MAGRFVGFAVERCHARVLRHEWVLEFNRVSRLPTGQDMEIFTALLLPEVDISCIVIHAVKPPFPLLV